MSAILVQKPYPVNILLTKPHHDILLFNGILKDQNFPHITDLNVYTDSCEISTPQVK